MDALSRLFEQAREIGGEHALRPPYEGPVALPESWERLWRTHDGQGESLTGLFGGYTFMPVEGPVDSVLASREELSAQGYEGWFPIAKDFGGAFLAIDPDGVCWELDGREDSVWADDLEALAERSLGERPRAIEPDGMLAGMQTFEVDVPEDWKIGEEIPLAGGHAHLVRLGREALGFEACLLDTEPWVVAMGFDGEPQKVEISRTDSGFLGTTRGFVFAFDHPRAVRVTLDPERDDELNRFSPPVSPISLLELQRYAEVVSCSRDREWLPAAYAQSWGRGVVDHYLAHPDERYARQTRAECREAVAQARATLGLPADLEDASERERIIAAWGLLQHDDLDGAEALIQAAEGDGSPLWRVLRADLMFARGEIAAARRVLAEVSSRDLAWSTPFDEGHVARLLDRRYPEKRTESKPVQVLDDALGASIEWVSDSHLRVRMTPDEARQGKTVVLEELGVGVRLPAGAGHGLSLTQEVDGQRIRVEAWIESPSPDLSFDRWDATFRCRPGEQVSGPYGPIDVAAGTTEVPNGGLKRPNGEHGSLTIEWLR